MTSQGPHRQRVALGDELTAGFLPVHAGSGDLQQSGERPAGEAQALADRSEFGGCDHAVGMSSSRSTSAV